MDDASRVFLADAALRISRLRSRDLSKADVYKKLSGWVKDDPLRFLILKTTLLTQAYNGSIQNVLQLSDDALNLLVPPVVKKDRPTISAPLKKKAAIKKQITRKGPAIKKKS